MFPKHWSPRNRKVQEEKSTGDNKTRRTRRRSFEDAIGRRINFMNRPPPSTMATTKRLHRQRTMDDRRHHNVPALIFYIRSSSSANEERVI